MRKRNHTAIIVTFALLLLLGQGTAGYCDGALIKHNGSIVDSQWSIEKKILSTALRPLAQDERGGIPRAANEYEVAKRAGAIKFLYNFYRHGRMSVQLGLEPGLPKIRKIDLAQALNDLGLPDEGTHTEYTENELAQILADYFKRDYRNGEMPKLFSRQAFVAMCSNSSQAHLVSVIDLFRVKYKQQELDNGAVALGTDWMSGANVLAPALGFIHWREVWEDSWEHFFERLAGGGKPIVMFLPVSPWGDFPGNLGKATNMEIDWLIRHLFLEKDLRVPVYFVYGSHHLYDENEVRAFYEYHRGKDDWGKTDLFYVLAIDLLRQIGNVRVSKEYSRGFHEKAVLPLSDCVRRALESDL
ncbi:MAG: hypothetical protein WCG78_05890 [Candidatus Omnitrophota bacterium]